MVLLQVHGTEEHHREMVQDGFCTVALCPGNLFCWNLSAISGTWVRCWLYPNEANAKKANVIFWFVGQNVSDEKGVHHWFARYCRNPVQNTVCYSCVGKSCRQDSGVKKD